MQPEFILSLKTAVRVCHTKFSVNSFIYDTLLRKVPAGHINNKCNVCTLLSFFWMDRKLFNDTTLSFNKWMIAFSKLKGIPKEIVVTYSKTRFVENRSKGQVLQ